MCYFILLYNSNFTATGGALKTLSNNFRTDSNYDNVYIFNPHGKYDYFRDKSTELMCCLSRIYYSIPVLNFRQIGSIVVAF